LEDLERRACGALAAREDFPKNDGERERLLSRRAAGDPGAERATAGAVDDPGENVPGEMLFDYGARIGRPWALGFKVWTRGADGWALRGAQARVVNGSVFGAPGHYYDAEGGEHQAHGAPSAPHTSRAQAQNESAARTRGGGHGGAADHRGGGHGGHGSRR
jgi:hypothetical protein